MTSKPLTDMLIRRIAPSATPQKIFDGHGMFLYVPTSGNRLWRMAYRYRGKPNTLSFGPYPIVTLAEARKRRDAARTLLAAGIDPAAVARDDRRARVVDEASSFREVGRRYLETRRPYLAHRYWKVLSTRMEGDIYPSLGDCHVNAVTPSNLLATIRVVEARGAVQTAKRIKNHCGEVFRFAMAEGLADKDPSAPIGQALAPQPAVTHRPKFAAAHLPGFFAALARYDGDRMTVCALRLALLTFVRTNEIRFAEWSEFDNLESPDPAWRIPAKRMKMQRDHVVPLAQQTVAVLRRIRGLAPSDRYLFAKPKSRAGVMSENTMLFALYRMGYHSRATVHGFRGTASTILNERGFNRDWVERQLAHVEGDAVRGAYNAAEWLAGRRKMMQWWADFLDGQEEISGLVG